MKRKIALLLVMVLALSIVLPGCGKKDSSNKQKFVVGFDAEFEPYGFKNEAGEYVGFDLDLAQEVCKRNDWELVKQPINWDSKDMELKSKAIDCIWNGFTINGREDKYTWSSPYVNNSQVFVTKKSSGITAKAGMSGKIIAVQKESSAAAALGEEENAALKKSFSKIIEFGDYNTAFMELDMGTVDVIAMDIGVAKAQMSSRDASKYTILSENLSTEKYGVGFLLGNTELRDKVEATLQAMLKDGTFLKIAQKWNLQDSVCLGE